MSKTVKKVLSILLCAALLFGAAPLNGFAGLRLPELSALFAPVAHAADPSGTCGDNLTWNYDTSTKTLTISGTGAMNDYSSVDYNNAKVTNAPWKEYYNTMKTVIISDGVTNIGAYAFRGCSGLTSVSISDSVTSIGGSAFNGCTELINVMIPDSVISINTYAFYNCTKLTSDLWQQCCNDRQLCISLLQKPVERHPSRQRYEYRCLCVFRLHCVVKRDHLSWHNVDKRLCFLPLLRSDERNNSRQHREHHRSCFLRLHRAFRCLLRRIKTAMERHHDRR